MSESPAADRPGLLEQARTLLFREARCLDEQRFEDWVELFAEDGVYWIPSTRGQTDPLNIPSIVYENKPLLAMRAARLANPRTYQMNPRPGTTHLVSNVYVDESSGMTANAAIDATSLRVHSVVLVHEIRDEQRRFFSGQCAHTLRLDNGVLKIVLKRVDLFDCDAVQSAFMVPL